MSIRLRPNVRSRIRGFCLTNALPLAELGVASACVLLIRSSFQRFQPISIAS